MSNEEIDKFFEWFKSNSTELTRASNNPRLVSILSERVEMLNPEIAWEIGPGDGAAWRFTLSPDGNTELCAEVRNIISRAPAISGWEFCAFRQPKEAQPIIELETPHGIVEIDATLAEYALLKARDGTFDLVIKLQHVNSLQKHEKRALAVLLLDGLIGEEARMSLIKNVEFVEELESRYVGRTTSIRHLRNHLVQQSRRERADHLTQ